MLISKGFSIRALLSGKLKSVIQIINDTKKSSISYNNALLYNQNLHSIIFNSLHYFHS